MNIKERLLFIDGYKGILCITVFLFHYFSTFSFLFGQNIDNLIKDTPLFILIDGVWAVRAFVLLSAFSISLSLSSGKDVPSLVVKRYFRLAYPVGGAILIAFVIQPFFHVMEISSLTGNTWIETFDADYSLTNLVKNLLLCVPVGYNKYSSVSWMIQYLFWGAFLVVVLHKAVSKMTLKKKVVFLLFFVFITFKMSELYSLVVMGMLLEQTKDYLFVNRGLLYELILFLMIIFSFFIYYKLSLGVGSFVSSTFIIISVLSSKFLRQLLSMKLFQILGKYSFEIFLLHCPIIFSLSSYLYLTNSFGCNNHLILLIITTMIVFVSAFVYKEIIEKKLLDILVVKTSNFFLKH